MESLEQLGRYEEAEKCSDKAGSKMTKAEAFGRKGPRSKILFWK